jgi:hypothetical protein
MVRMRLRPNRNDDEGVRRAFAGDDCWPTRVPVRGKIRMGQIWTVEHYGDGYLSCDISWTGKGWSAPDLCRRDSRVAGVRNPSDRSPLVLHEDRLGVIEDLARTLGRCL